MGYLLYSFIGEADMEVYELIANLILLQFHNALISEHVEKSVICSSAFAETDSASLAELIKYTTVFDSTLLCDLRFLSPGMMVLPRGSITFYMFLCPRLQSRLQ